MYEMKYKYKMLPTCIHFFKNISPEKERGTGLKLLYCNSTVLIFLNPPKIQINVSFKSGSQLF